VRPDQDMIPETNRMAQRASQHRVLHDHAVGADLDRPALRGEHGAEEDPAVRPDGDIPTQHGCRGAAKALGEFGRAPLVHAHEWNLTPSGPLRYPANPPDSLAES
jgi:hypothetical protein